MATITENYRINNDQTVTTETGRFLVEQRNEGFAENDGAWIVSQLPELYWGRCGVLRRRRPGKFLGVFSSTDEASAAIDSATPTEIDDKALN